MCTIPAIRLINMILTGFKIVLVIYLFSVGVYMSSSLDLLHSFGSEFIHFGLSLIFLGILSAGILYPLKFGVDRHNRFLLVVGFIFETVIFINLLVLASQINAFSFPLFNKLLQLDCLKNTPTQYKQSECAAFYNADRTAGFRLVWEYYFTGRSDPANNQVLAQLQGSTCCGFFPPSNCIPNTASFPSIDTLTGIDKKFISQRVICGPYPGFYPQQSDCTNYENIVLQTVGGCNFDLGVGSCVQNSVQPYSAGCASAMEDYMISKITPHVALLIGSSFFNFFSMLIACCMWWKRKETDVFPEFGSEKLHSIRYSNVKYQFEVMPKRNILQAQGFLPPINASEVNIEEGKEAESEIDQ